MEEAAAEEREDGERPRACVLRVVAAFELRLAGETDDGGSSADCSSGALLSPGAEGAEGDASPIWPVLFCAWRAWSYSRWRSSARLASAAASSDVTLSLADKLREPKAPPVSASQQKGRSN